MEILSTSGFSALLQVIAIDLVLAGDNAIIIGMAAAGLPAVQKRKAILIGIAAATVLRIFFALITRQLLAFGPVLLIAGGFLLLWVCWKMWRELSSHKKQEEEIIHTLEHPDQTDPQKEMAFKKSWRKAAIQIVIADISMSLDNVLAVAGASIGHPTVLVIGLALSIALMGLAASFVANLLCKYPWITYIGLFIILYVALRMTADGLMHWIK